MTVSLLVAVRPARRPVPPPPAPSPHASTSVYFVVATVGLAVLASAILCRMSLRQPWRHRRHDDSLCARLFAWPAPSPPPAVQRGRRPVAVALTIVSCDGGRPGALTALLTPPPPPPEYSEVDTVLPPRGASPPPEYSTLERPTGRTTV